MGEVRLDGWDMLWGLRDERGTGSHVVRTGGWRVRKVCKLRNREERIEVKVD